jgi:REP element-mobilizing transposase RayT
MTPQLDVKTDISDDYLKSLISCISKTDCSNFFSNHIGESQNKQKDIVKKFQQYLHSNLELSFQHTNWELEYKPDTNRRDAIDIYGENKSSIIAIEIDKNRADQVAKKFVSRMALLPDEKIYFISLCYPGTAAMNKSECIKYFNYCNNIAEQMNNLYAGFTIE